MVEKTIYRKTINWYAFYKIFATFSDKKSMFFSGEKQLFLKKNTRFENSYWEILLFQSPSTANLILILLTLVFWKFMAHDW